MIRLFLSGDFTPHKNIELSPNQSHYLTHVMRQKENQQIHCFNGRSGEWLGLIRTGKKVSIQLDHQIQTQKNLPELVLCPALIKRDKMDLIWQKATELGATKIYPIIAEHCVVRSFNLEHAQSIIYEAAEQCERMDIPTLYPATDLATLLTQLKPKYHLIWMSERGTTTLTQNTLPPAIFVGPEGGWSPKETQLLQQQAQAWHLGQTILRAETACFAGLAIWQNKNQ